MDRYRGAQFGHIKRSKARMAPPQAAARDLADDVGMAKHGAAFEQLGKLPIGAAPDVMPTGLPTLAA